jgi:hypothetical protein
MPFGVNSADEGTSAAGARRAFDKLAMSANVPVEQAFRFSGLR